MNQPLGCLYKQRLNNIRTGFPQHKKISFPLKTIRRISPHLLSNSWGVGSSLQLTSSRICRTFQFRFLSEETDVQQSSFEAVETRLKLLKKYITKYPKCFYNGVRSEMQFGRGRYDQFGLFGCVAFESDLFWAWRLGFRSLNFKDTLRKKLLLKDPWDFIKNY